MEVSLEEVPDLRRSPEPSGRVVACSHVEDGDLSAGTLDHAGVSLPDGEGVDVKETVGRRNPRRN